MNHFEPYNAAAELLDRNAGRSDKVAVIDRDGAHTYGDVTDGANRFGEDPLGSGGHQPAMDPQFHGVPGE